MSLRYAILALLSVEPMTGYDLRGRFESSVGHVWHAPDSQIYPELRKMESAGLLISSSVARGERGQKRWYRITDDGAAEFRRWMNEPPDYRRVRDPAHLKASYLEWAEPDSAREFFRAHIDHFTGELQQWREQARQIENNESDMLNSRLAVTPVSRRRRTIAFKQHTYAGLIARAEQEIGWARRGLELIDDLDGAEG
ncbi:PadR family transcriptional regulator [Spelaeicoccus albus]|nr:PadR family transcriptional regulator [Spelaeicoccus albus]